MKKYYAERHGLLTKQLQIDFDELSDRMQQVADWISTVEKSVNAQPEWVNYY